MPLDIKIEMEPFKSCEHYKDFKKKYKSVIKKLSLKRDNDVDSLLINIWNFSNQKFKEGFDQGILEKKSKEELIKETNYVGPIFLEEDSEGL